MINKMFSFSIKNSTLAGVHFLIYILDLNKCFNNLKIMLFLKSLLRDIQFEGKEEAICFKTVKRIQIDIYE